MTQRQKPAGEQPEVDPAAEDAPAADAPEAPEAELVKPGDGELDEVPIPEPEASAESPADEDDEPRAYRARQALYGPQGVIPAGGLFIARPSSPKARSNFAELVEDGEQVPASVAAALADAEG